MKSAKQVSREYRNRLKNLAIRGEELFVAGKLTRNELCTTLEIDSQTATDVIAVMNNAKLYRVKGFARGLMIKGILASICFTISTIIWVTVGGFAILSTAALLTILIAATIIPLAVTWGFRAKAKHTLEKNTDNRRELDEGR